MSPRERIPGRPLSHLLLVALLALAAVSCSRKESKPAGEPGVQTYQVEGTIQALPSPGAAKRVVTIAHDAIPDFVNSQGKKTGMKAMTMPFELANDVSLEGIAVGDRVRFTLVVNWTATPRFQITRLEKIG